MPLAPPMSIDAVEVTVAVERAVAPLMPAEVSATALAFTTRRSTVASMARSPPLPVETEAAWTEVWAEMPWVAVLVAFEAAPAPSALARVSAMVVEAARAAIVTAVMPESVAPEAITVSIEPVLVAVAWPDEPAIRPPPPPIAQTSTVSSPFVSIVSAPEVAVSETDPPMSIRSTPSTRPSGFAATIASAPAALPSAVTVSRVVASVPMSIEAAEIFVVSSRRISVWG